MLWSFITMTTSIGSVLLVGMGGIGSHLLSPLRQLLGDIPLYVCDGDSFETKNLERQSFLPINTKLNKGLANSHHLVTSIPFYLTPDNIEDVYVSLVFPAIIIVAVDNNATRKLTLDAIKYVDDLGDLTWISPSNGLDNVQVSVYTKGQPHPCERYSNIREPEDSIPNTGCSDLVTTHPQLLRTNHMAASVTLSLVHDLIQGHKLPVEVSFDLLSYQAQGIKF